MDDCYFFRNASMFLHSYSAPLAQDSRHLTVMILVGKTTTKIAIM